MPLPETVVPLVRRTFGSDTTVVASEPLGNWAVARLQVHTSDGPTSVIAKWLRATPDRSDPRQMITESVGLQFVDELAPGLVPRVLAAEFDHTTGGILLLEDLSPARPLDDLIRREGAAGTAEGRRAFARSMGTLAASTAGHDQDFSERLGVTVAMDPEAARLRILGPSWEKVHSLMNHFGVRISAAAEKEAAGLRAVFADPGPFLALSSGDMATNNFMINTATPSAGHLIDFEFAHFDHALAHAANFFVPGPPWMVIQDPLAEQLEHDFRTALVKGIPEAADDEPYAIGLAAGCVAMGFERCGNLTVMDDRPPGHASRTQRIFTLEAAATAAEARGHWSALTDLLRELAKALRHRWPDADQDPSTFAPYSPRG